MIKINKSLLIFSGFIFVLGAASFIVLQKLLPFVRHNGYYCQSVQDSLALPISHVIGAVPFIFAFTFFVMAVTKLMLILHKAHRLRKNLINKKNRYNTSFSLLLQKLQLTDYTYLIKSDKQFAFCLGIRSPKIYISTSLVQRLSQPEVEAVLRHEKYHLNNHDTLTMTVASIGESLLPFFPLLSDFLHNYRIEREIKADQEAVKGLGDKRPLVGVLKKMLEVKSVAVIPVASIAEHDTLEFRILKLIKKEDNFKKFNIKHVLISTFTAFIMGVIVISPVQAFEVHQNGKDIMMICTNGGTCMNSCKKEYSAKDNNHSEELLYSPVNNY